MLTTATSYQLRAPRALLRNVCLRARKPSETALKRQDAFREHAFTAEPPNFFEEPGFPSKSDRLRKKEVVAAALNSSAVLTTLGCIGCVLVPTLAQRLALPISITSLLSLQHFPSYREALLAVVAGILVTASRQLLISVWPALRESNEGANNKVCATQTAFVHAHHRSHRRCASDHMPALRWLSTPTEAWSQHHGINVRAATHCSPSTCVQLLLTRPPVEAPDLLLIACVPAFAEELLFRGALVGSLGASAFAVLIVAALFGALHVSGGRNVASGVFAAWAGAVYGGVYVATGSVWAAALAHGAGNASSAAVWLRAQPPKWLSMESDDEGALPGSER
jgi:Type II CAAX prenyl endopeptidase Rce1-like